MSFDPIQDQWDRDADWLGQQADFADKAEQAEDPDDED